MTTNAGMEELIQVINDLHDAFSDIKMDIKLNLPQIAVVGSQSSGKSSVLENIVGKDFLPRGSGIVTRCPLVLQLVQLPPTKDEEWGEFLHKPGVKMTDFAEIRREIERRTVEVAGAASITDKPISLKVYSPHVLTLTLVDLPGMVMNAVGDQPKDIDKQIKDMVTKYVTPANTIILAVTPANADLATSQALRLAKQVDPEGVRTLGVLTKLDLMDRGTNALDMLSGKQINLRRGFIGVVNRSQQDINEEKDIRAARVAEKEYFKNHSAYSEVADRQGTEYLCKTLNQLLMEHIQSALPDLKAHVDKLVNSTHKQMEKLGMFDEQAIEHGALLLQHIKTFSDGLNHAIDGGVTDANKELMGGARLDYIFHESFANYVTNLRASKDLTDEYIRINMRNMAGMNATLFPSDQVFMALSRQQIAKLEDPSIKCVNFVHDELHKIVEMCAAKLDRYPSLKKRVLLICSQLIQSYRTPTQAHIRTLIASEKGYINVKHPVMQQLSSQSIANMNAQQYAANNPQPQAPPAPGQPAPQGGARAASIPAPSPMSRPMYDVPSKIQLGSNMSPHESAQNAAIREMVEGYFSIVQQNIADQVPKAINLLMIMKLRENIYAQLVRHLYKDELLADLLSESPDIAAQRKGTSTMMKCLNKAQDALAKVADFIPEK
jgi:dynamin 1-like protein